MNISRRTILGATAALAAATQSVITHAHKGSQMSSTGKFDTHHHFLPDAYIQAYGPELLAATNPLGKVPSWSPQGALDTCDAMGIAKAIVSISPGFGPIDQKVRTGVIRTCNEIGAKLVSDYPHRFGQFASINMTVPADALNEAEYALDTLQSAGVVVFTNYDGRYLGDPFFDEIWQELNRRKAVVFIHPSSPPYKLTGQPSESVMEYPFDSTRTATSLVFSGTTLRYPDIKFILSHAGGTLPFLVDRIAGGALLNQQLRERLPDPMSEFRKFWFDTAISGNKAALSALMALADPNRILFGSDYPFAPNQIIALNSKGLDEFSMDADSHSKILRGNALKLFGDQTM